MATALAGTYQPAAMADDASRETPVAAQADRVKVERRYGRRFNRVVGVESACARRACFTVTVAARKDPLSASRATKKESFRYGGTLRKKDREAATGARDGGHCMDVEGAGAVHQVTSAVWVCFVREEASPHYQTKTLPGAHTRAVSLSCVRVGTRTGKDLIK